MSSHLTSFAAPGRAASLRPWGLSVVALGAMGLALAGCAERPMLASACPVGPALKAETIPNPPVSEAPLVWRPGHWDWNGATYTWAGGTWVPRAGNGTAWLEGHWALVNGACAWVPAHWVN